MDRRLFSLADEQLFPDLREHLRVSLDQLERCQKALSDFLEEKRSAMPRFYFIGDEDLLEILGQVLGVRAREAFGSGADRIKLHVEYIEWTRASFFRAQT